MFGISIIIMKKIINRKFDKKSKEIEKKLIKSENNNWKNETDYGIKMYKKGWSECASHFIQMINDLENQNYKSTNY